MTGLHPRIPKALFAIDFIRRYKEISDTVSAERMSADNRLIYIDGQEVMEMITDLGYCPLFDAEEKFYKITEEGIENISFCVHSILYSGMVDLVWIVRENGALLLGAPPSLYSRRLIGASCRIKKSIIKTYEDLEDILKAAFRHVRGLYGCLSEGATR